MELTPGPTLFNGRRVVRAVAVLIFGAGIALCGARVVGSKLEPELFIPLLIAVFVGWLTSRLPLLLRGLVQAVGFAGAAVLIAYAYGGSSGDVVDGLLDGPRQVVTTSWPSPRFVTIFVALGALIHLATAIGIDLAMRLRWRAAAIAPLVAGLVAMIAAGAPDGAQWQAVAFAGAGSFVLLWIGLDDRVASVRAGATVALGAALAALVAWGTVSVAAADRANPRRTENPNKELALIDPLAQVAAQRNAETPRDLYIVSSAQLSQLRYWRTAALDSYNGEAWSTAGELTPVGSKLDIGTSAPDISVTVEALTADTSLWVAPGRLLRTTAPVETDTQRHVVRILGTERPAVTTFTVEAVPDFSADAEPTLATIQPTEIESSFSTVATSLAGSGTIAQQVEALAKKLHDDYTLNTKTPGGVQQSLIDSFLGQTKVGNVQQFVTGFVLLARSLGVDARVATGFVLDTTATSAFIRTADAQAWAEVRVGGQWAAVDVLPENSQVTPPPPTAGQPQTPAAAQPQDPPAVQQADQNQDTNRPPVVTPQDSWPTVKVWLLRGGLFTGLLLWPFVVFAIIVTWRKLGRRRGLKAADPARRVETAWVLATDALIDAGATLATSQTNAEVVAAGVDLQPAAASPLGRLQRHADAVTFATAPCDPNRAEDAVQQLHSIETSIRNSSTRWWRWKWWFSTRSLRKATQSPFR